MSLAACRFPRCPVECEIHSPPHLHKGVTYTVHEILTFITRLMSFCLQSLHHRFVDWTKPSNTALILGTLTDLSRNKSELVAENALLRKPLIILLYWLLGTSIQKMNLCARSNEPLVEGCEIRVQSTKVILLLISGDTPIFIKRVAQLVSRGFNSIKRRVYFSFQTLEKRFSYWIKPTTASLLLGTFTEISKGKSELLAENALLRQQLIILHRQIKRPIFRKRDRLLLVLLARMVRTWQQALFIVQPETVLRWHRQLFRLFWKRKSKVHSNQPRISLETITLIKEMATNNRLWGAQRIRGELLKLGIHICKRTIQKYMRQARVPRPGGQNWSTFLRNHAKEVWACDFLQVTDLFFRPLFALSNTWFDGHMLKGDRAPLSALA